MQKRRYIPLLLFTTALLLLAGGSLGAAPMVPDNGVIVKFEDTGRTLSSVSRSYSGTDSVERLKSRGGEVLLKAKSADQLSDLIGRLRDDPSVEYFSLNVVKHLSYIPDDPLFENGFPGQITFENQYYHRLIRAPQAWNTTTGSDDIVVAVIDSGVGLGHPDLEDNLWTNSAEVNGVDGEDDDNNGFVDDIHGVDTTCIGEVNGGANNECDASTPQDKDFSASNGHGMAVAGLISAVSDNGQGMAGLAGGGNGDPGVRLMPVRAGTTTIQVADEVEAIDYAAANGADVINLSFGGQQGGQVEINAIQRAREDGAVLVAAAGNQNQGQVVYDYPAKFDEVIGVGSTTIQNPGGDPPEEVFASFSKFDPQEDAQSLVAPGNQMITLYSNGEDHGWRTPNAEGAPQFTDPLNGTSFSSPLVAGAAALVLSADPSLTPSQVTSILERTADDLNGDGYDRRLGHGRVNVQRAVALASGGLPTGDLNGDGTVNQDDLEEIRDKFGAERGDSEYNRTVDLNNDGVIDELDALIIAENFGESNQ